MEARCGGNGLAADSAVAQLDHIVPRTRGGSHDLENLRWVTTRANLAKRDLTDEEFLDLCVNVAEWIGRRLDG
jgi:5-methylcytosine-specific restriction endonuclease McrA